MAETNMVRLVVKVLPEQKAALDRMAAREDRTLSASLRRALDTSAALGPYRAVPPARPTPDHPDPVPFDWCDTCNVAVNAEKHLDWHDRGCPSTGEGGRLPLGSRPGYDPAKAQRVIAPPPRPIGGQDAASGAGVEERADEMEALKVAGHSEPPPDPRSPGVRTEGANATCTHPEAKRLGSRCQVCDTKVGPVGVIGK